MLFKYWDSFAIGFLSIIGAFAGGLYWGCTSESPDYLSYTTTNRASVVTILDEAKRNGDEICVNRLPGKPVDTYWLHSC